MIFYTILTSWLISLFALLTSLHLWRKKRLTDKLFASFWFLVFFLWLLGGSRALLDSLSLYQISEIIPYIVQIIVPIHFLPFVLFVILRLTKNATITKYAGYLTSVFAVIYIYYIFSDGLSPTSQTIYGPDNAIPQTAAFVFQMIFFLGLPLLIFDFLLSLYKTFDKLNSSSFYYFLPVLSFLIYALGGYFDQEQLELKLGWQILLLRLIYLISVLIAYVYSTKKGK